MVNMEHGQGTGVCCKAQHEKKTRSLEAFGVARVATPFTDSTLGGTPLEITVLGYLVKSPEG